MKKNTGFTLIELLVVVAIIGLLASVVLASLGGARSSARDATRVQDLGQLRTAMELYINSCGEYPATLDTGANNGCESGDTTLGDFIQVPTPPGGTASSTYGFSSNGNDYCVSADLENDDNEQANTFSACDSSLTDPGGDYYVGS